MKIKFLKKHAEYEIDTIVDMDDVQAKALIKSKSAIEYTDEMEAADKKADDEAVAEEVAKTTKAKKEAEEKAKPSGIEVRKGPVSEWKSMNEFLRAVRNAGEKGILDQRLIQKASAGMGEDVNADGGFLVQHITWNQEIFNAYIQESVIAPKCRQFIAEPYANGLKFKQVNETTRAGGTWFGGVQFFEVDEGVNITPSQPVFSQLDVPIKQMGALYYLTQALVDDCPNLSSYVAGLVGKAYGQAVDNEVLFGTLGIMTAVVGHLSTVQVPIAGVNPTAKELSTMYCSMGAGYLNGAEWYMSHSQFSALMQLTSPAGTAQGSYPIMTIDAANPTRYLLFGHKVNVTESAAATTAYTSATPLATAGSILFANFNEYAIVTKGTMVPQVAMSLHVMFLSNQQTYRFIARMGGAPLLKSKVQLKDGTRVSSVVQTV